MKRTGACGHCPWVVTRFRENRASGLALGELEAGAGALLSVLLALLHARIAREETGLLQPLAKLGVVNLKGAGDAVTDRTGLTARTTTINGDDEIELVVRLGERERLLD